MGECDCGEVENIVGLVLMELLGCLLPSTFEGWSSSSSGGTIRLGYQAVCLPIV